MTLLRTRALSFLRIDMPIGTRQPSLWRFVIASIIAIAGSLGACAALVALGTRLFPSTVGYPHFQFSDYGKLTVVGVAVACLAWPVVTWFSSEARRPFFYLTVLVTLGGLAPDAWILYQGQPAEAVGVLVAMHLALAVITYSALVLIAPQRTSRQGRADVLEP